MTKTVTRKDNSPAPPPPDFDAERLISDATATSAPTTEVEFFALNMRANFDPEDGATVSDAILDIQCLLGSGLAAIETKHESLDEVSWAGVYMLRQAKAALSRLDECLPQGTGGQLLVHSRG